jgi:hypothetical protein
MQALISSLTSDYSEPNIKVKGDLPPRRAVLPVYEATGSGNPKIVEVEEAAGSSKPVPSNPRTTQTVSGQQLSDIAKNRRGKEKLKPKHAFDVVESSTEGAKQGFIMTIQLPEEVSHPCGSDQALCADNSSVAAGLGNESERRETRAVSGPSASVDIALYS